MTQEISWHPTPEAGDPRHQSTNRVGNFTGAVAPPASERGNWRWNVAGDEEAGSTPLYARYRRGA